MKLYIKQKVFSWRDTFTVKDEFGADRYYVQGKFISFGKQLTVSNAQGQEVAFLKQKLLTIFPKFSVLMNGEEVARIVKKFSFFKPKYYVEGLDWEVQGSFLEHDYTITKDGAVVAAIHKVWMAFGDSFEIDIQQGQNEAVALSVVLAIDAVMDSQQRSVSFSVGDQPSCFNAFPWGKSRTPQGEKRSFCCVKNPLRQKEILTRT